MDGSVYLLAFARLVRIGGRAKPSKSVETQPLTPRLLTGPNPTRGQSPLYTSLGVITKGTIIEVNVSELGLVTTTGKVVWGKYAQVTNNPENDGCINAVLLV